MPTIAFQQNGADHALGAPGTSTGMHGILPVSEQWKGPGRLEHCQQSMSLVWCLANSYALFGAMEARWRAAATQAMRCHR
jgi:hypothetical protein